MRKINENPFVKKYFMNEINSKRILYTQRKQIKFYQI